jgi:Uma2 family endonuclease
LTEYWLGVASATLSTEFGCASDTLPIWNGFGFATPNRAKIRDAKPIALADDSEPVPDIAVVKPLGKVYLEHHPYAEDILWLIEFSKATLKKDLTEKKAIYGEAGIGEYWVVDLNNRALWVFRDWEDGVYGTALRLSDGTVTPLAFQDIAIPVQVLMG